MAGIGRPRAVMSFNLIGLALKVPLNAIFMYGAEPLGIPALGSTGCAVSSAVIAWVSVLLGWTWCARQREFADYALFARFSLPSGKALVGLLRLGVPIGGAFFVDVTAFAFMALFVARLGANVSAAHQIAANLAVVTFMIPTALGNAAGVLTGQSLGAGDAARARHIGGIGLAVGLAIGLFVGAVLWLVSGPLAAAYTVDANVIGTARTLLVLVACYHVADALQSVAINVLRGYKRTAVPTAIYMVALWGVGLGGGYLLAFANPLGEPMGVAGFWIAATASLWLAGIAMTLYFRRVSTAMARVSSAP
jgi:MATE family multidrug resistance protein